VNAPTPITVIDFEFVREAIVLALSRLSVSALTKLPEPARVPATVNFPLFVNVAPASTVRL
jgi:hypothetical protein